MTKNIWDSPALSIEKYSQNPSVVISMIRTVVWLGQGHFNTCSVTSYIYHLAEGRTHLSFLKDTHEKDTTNHHTTKKVCTNQLTIGTKRTPHFIFWIVQYRFLRVASIHIYSTSSQWFRMSGGRNWDSKLIMLYPFSIRYEMMKPSAYNYETCKV